MSEAPEIIQSRGFQVEVVRSNRKKTATLKVEDGKVLVLVPKSTRKTTIETLINKKTRWVREKLLLQRQHPPANAKEYVNGECFTYLGRNFRLKVESGPVKSVKLKSGRLVVQVPKSAKDRERYVKNALTEWYREHALEKLKEKVVRYSKVVKAEPESVGIKTFGGRWGSCSTKDQMVFNWKIIIAPNRIVDYVVVHELCHLHEHNHSPKFWKHVERVFPDYIECREWLKMNGRQLTID